jgi:hypothetical protein
MKIKHILEELELADDDAQMICVVPNVRLKSRIYVVGQVLENIPGVVLGNREPHLREKTVGTFKEELCMFSPRFEESDFLFESTHKINERTYEIRFYKLTYIKIENGEVVLYSQAGELEELRETHREAEYE